MKQYSHTCSRCKRTKNYTVPHRGTNESSCTYCKGISDDTLHLFIESEVYAVKCPRCNTIKTYKNKHQIKLSTVIKTGRCCKCNTVSDKTLPIFISRGVYARECPVCNDIVECKNKTYLAYCEKNKIPCISCSNNTNNELRQQKFIDAFWSKVVGSKQYKLRKRQAVVRYWESCSEEERNRILNLSQKQKDYFWGHLRRRNRNAGHKLTKQIFAEKYSGDKHWMRRPDVYLKVIKSCEKYKGNGHWFRRNRG